VQQRERAAAGERDSSSLFLRRVEGLGLGGEAAIARFQRLTAILGSDIDRMAI
jgi:hypothetical protein